MDVGIRELKAKLSAYVARAKSGEVIRVTDRGKPVAQLSPLPPVEETAIERGLREGWITPGNGAPPRKHWRGYKGSMTVHELLDEDRGE